MLWEPVDPDLALAERFGFVSLAAVEQWLQRSLAQCWGIDAHGCTRVVISDRNAIAWVASDRGALVVKWSAAPERFASLRTSTGLLHQLAIQGLPVAAPFPALDGRVRVERSGPAGELSVAVLAELSGEWLDVDDPAAVRSAGVALAQVHRALGSSTLDTTGVTQVVGLTHWISLWLEHADRGAAPEASLLLGELLAQVDELEDGPQLVHNDYRAANLLMQGSAAVGVLDFDDVVVGHRVNDLAKASVYLGTRFTHWRPTSVDAQRQLRAGYESVRPLTSSEAQWFELLVLWQGLMAIPEHDTGGWAAAL
jgi:Ser/Thr protein kinase RdoA (MazF antagonist)